jgi:hypothetical protein
MQVRGRVWPAGALVLVPGVDSLFVVDAALAGSPVNTPWSQPTQPNTPANKRARAAPDGAAWRRAHATSADLE